MKHMKQLLAVFFACIMLVACQDYASNSLNVTAPTKTFEFNGMTLQVPAYLHLSEDYSSDTQKLFLAQNNNQKQYTTLNLRAIPFDQPTSSTSFTKQLDNISSSLSNNGENTVINQKDFTENGNSYRVISYESTNEQATFKNQTAIFFSEKANTMYYVTLTQLKENSLDFSKDFYHMLETAAFTQTAIKRQVETTDITFQNMLFKVPSYYEESESSTDTIKDFVVSNISNVQYATLRIFSDNLTQTVSQEAFKNSLDQLTKNLVGDDVTEYDTKDLTINDRPARLVTYTFSRDEVAYENRTVLFYREDTNTIFFITLTTGKDNLSDFVPDFETFIDNITSEK